MDARLDPLQVTGGDHLGVDEVLDGSAGKVPDVIAGEDHGLSLRIAHLGALCTPSGGRVDYTVMRLALENRSAQIIGLSKL
jgi:hypothetical protein